MSNDTADTLILGSGFMGRAAAHFLRKAGQRVVVVDSAFPLEAQLIQASQGHHLPYGTRGIRTFAQDLPIITSLERTQEYVIPSRVAGHPIALTQGKRFPYIMQFSDREAARMEAKRTKDAGHRVWIPNSSNVAKNCENFGIHNPPGTGIARLYGCHRLNIHHLVGYLSSNATPANSATYFGTQITGYRYDGSHSLNLTDGERTFDITARNLVVATGRTLTQTLHQLHALKTDNKQEPNLPDRLKLTEGVTQVTLSCLFGNNHGIKRLPTLYDLNLNEQVTLSDQETIVTKRNGLTIYSFPLTDDLGNILGFKIGFDAARNATEHPEAYYKLFPRICGESS